MQIVSASLNQHVSCPTSPSPCSLLKHVPYQVLPPFPGTPCGTACILSPSPCLDNLGSETWFLLLQPARVQTAPGTIHSGVLLVIKERQQVNKEEMRVAAMHRWNPVHTFLFSSRGKLLNANKAAKEASQNSAAGGSLQLCSGYPLPAPAPSSPHPGR